MVGARGVEAEITSEPASGAAERPTVFENPAQPG